MCPFFYAIFMKKPKARFTDHALDRMSQRQIKKDQVMQCLMFGERSVMNRHTIYEFNGLIVVVMSHGAIKTVYWKYEASEQTQSML